VMTVAVGISGSALATTIDEALLSATGGGYLQIRDYQSNDVVLDRVFDDEGSGSVEEHLEWINFLDPWPSGFHVAADGPDLGAILSPAGAGVPSVLYNGPHDSQFTWVARYDTRGQLGLSYTIDEAHLYFAAKGSEFADGQDLEANLIVAVSMFDMSSGVRPAQPFHQDIYRVKAGGNTGAVDVADVAIREIEGFTGTITKQIWESPDPEVPDNLDSWLWSADKVTVDVDIAGMNEVEVSYGVGMYSEANGGEGVARIQFGDPVSLNGITTTFIVPEPTSMMLLGLGGLSLLRRRRYISPSCERVTTRRATGLFLLYIITGQVTDSKDE